MKQVFDLFPTPVIRFTDILSSSELDKLFEKLMKVKTDERDMALIRGRSTYMERSSWRGNQADILSKVGLMEKMQEKVDEYTEHLKLKSLKVGNSWCAIQDVGGLLKDHIHGDSIVSAVFYVNVDERSSTIVFENPNPVAFFNYENVYKERVPYTHNFYRIIPEKGDLLMFPSWLRHGCRYNPNQTENRTVISFNTVREEFPYGYWFGYGKKEK